jgi:serine/threonine protein kinase
LLQVYDLQTGRPLGAGSFGTVRAVTHRSSGKEFALKTVEIKGLKDEAQFNLFMNEIEIMKVSIDAVFGATVVMHHVLRSDTSTSLLCFHGVSAVLLWTLFGLRRIGRSV